jgi:hypothetical protein
MKRKKEGYALCIGLCFNIMFHINCFFSNEVLFIFKNIQDISDTFSLMLVVKLLIRAFFLLPVSKNPKLLKKQSSIFFIVSKITSLKHLLI